MFHRSPIAARHRALIVITLGGIASFIGLTPLLRENQAPPPSELAAPDRSDTPPLSVALPLPEPALPETGAPLARPLTDAPGNEPATWQGETPVVLPLPSPPTPPRPVRELEVAAGDTLLGMLTRLGIARAEAHAAVDGLKDVYDPRRLRPGQRLEVETDAAASSIVRLEFEPNLRERIELVRIDDGAFRAQRFEKPTSVRERYVAAEVATSLHAAGVAEGVPPAVIGRLIKLFSWDVDFQRETRPGDRLAILYEEQRLGDGTTIGAGEVIYARLQVGGRTLEAFRFERDGAVEYFDREGRSLRKFLLRTPVSGARISSGYGMRRHPILGYNRMHRGVDFAAPTGTPIFAAGSGRLVRVGRFGSYGNYVRIDHGNGFETAYAHLSRFAKGMRSGRRVRQGEVIGYVGSTGRSTGPHLHFEVLKSGRQVNPLDVAQPPAESLRGDPLEAFELAIRATETRIALLATKSVAAGEPDQADASGG